MGDPRRSIRRRRWVAASAAAVLLLAACGDDDDDDAGSGADTTARGRWRRDVTAVGHERRHRSTRHDDRRHHRRHRRRTGRGRPRADHREGHGPDDARPAAGLLRHVPDLPHGRLPDARRRRSRRPLQLVPRLAESWEANPENTEFTFTLDPDATFSDGSPVTAADVKFSWERLGGLAGSASYLVAGMTSVEAPDDQTVVATFDAPNSAFLSIAAAPYMSIVNADAGPGERRDHRRRR